MIKSNRPMWAIYGVFFFQSAVLGNWIPRIPDIKQRLELSDTVLGFCLLALPLGTIVAFMLAPRLLVHMGLRGGCRVWLPVWALLFVLPALVNSTGGLFVVLLAAGIAIGMCEVAMNSKVDMIEHQIGARIMSKCHGFWSLGSMAGALLGAALAQWNWRVLEHFLCVMPLIAFTGFLCASALPSDTEINKASSNGVSQMFKLPSKAILLLCLMPVGIMMVEGAFIDWSAIFMREELLASPIIIGVTYAFFSAIMALLRLSGDALAARFGDELVVRVSAVSATVGIAVFALAPNTGVAFAGASLSGLGVAIVYPLAMSAAARRPGHVTDNVAAMSMLAFVSFLVSPPLIGIVSDLLGLRIALLLLVPFALMSVLLSKEIAR